MDKATIYEPPYELRKSWIEGYQKKTAVQEGEEKADRG